MHAKREKHLDYLDGWRGISIFLVVAGHFSLIPTIHGHDFYTARAVVEFLFVLSGRLMANILFVNRISVRQFYWRRFSRIFPALLWLVFALLVAREISISDAVLALSFTANYVPPSEPLEHVWSLCVEEHAYIILSVIAIVSRHRKINVAAVLFWISAVAMASGAIQTWIFHRGYEDEEVYRHSDVKISSVFYCGGYVPASSQDDRSANFAADCGRVWLDPQHPLFDAGPCQVHIWDGVYRLRCGDD